MKQYVTVEKEPHFIKAKFDSRCSKCGEVIKRDERIAYYKTTRRVFCWSCVDKLFLLRF